MGARARRARAPPTADMVVGLPDSGTPAAIGFAQESGIPYAEAVVRNRYVGRSFIQPDQTMRQHGIRLKFNPLPAVIAGKRLVVVDDSIVRGNTTRQIVAMLFDAGAAEVHMRISSPPILWPCYYGIDMADRAELVAAGRTVEEIAALTASRPASPTSRWRACSARWGARPSGYCRACFTGEYPIPIPDSSVKLRFEPGVPCPPRPRLRDPGTWRAGSPTATPGVRPRRRAAAHGGDRGSRRRRPDRLRRQSALPPGMREPMLVTCTDGVGTKLLLAQELGRLEGLGQDLVAMCVNDLACTGARAPRVPGLPGRGPPGPGRGERRWCARIAEACAAVGCALAGGETAEMPGLYAPGHFDLAGFACGVVERDEMLGAHRVREGDVVIGIPSSGLHSNGFSLVRALVADGALAADADLLLAPTRLYVGAPRAARGGRRRGARGRPHHGRRHSREPPAGAARGPDGRPRPLAVGAPGRRSTPSSRPGRVAEDEAWRTFNMGLGMCVVVAPESASGGARLPRRRPGGGAGGGRGRRGPHCLRGTVPSG